MDKNDRCQSCGQPISAEFSNLGTNEDGSKNEEYCSICFQNGEFTNPNLKLEEMIGISIDHMTSELNLPHEKASELANSFIPQLKRWR